MIYRVFGKTGLRVSALSLGTEYLINIPREKAVSVIHRAIDMGINYFDLFWAQAEFRDNMGAAFSGHRDKVMLAAHLGSADIDGQYTRIRDQRRSKSFFIDFLRRYKTEYADVLFLHNNDTREDYARIMGSGGLLELAQRMRRKGKARFIGLSSHNAETSRIAVESGEIDVLMFALNLASHALPGRDALLRACEKNNIALVVMKPFAGGNLLKKEASVELLDYQMGRTETAGDPMRFKKAVDISPVQCLSYVFEQSGVTTVVPGCATTKELDECLAYFEASAQEKDYSGLLKDFESYKMGQCVHCNHCLPCPSGIDIGGLLRLLDKSVTDLNPDLWNSYNGLSAKATDCVKCGACSKRCPFGVDVVSRMEEAAARF